MRELNRYTVSWNAVAYQWEVRDRTQDLRLVESYDTRQMARKRSWFLDYGVRQPGGDNRADA